MTAKPVLNMQVFRTTRVFVMMNGKERTAQYSSVSVTLTAWQEKRIIAMDLKTVIVTIVLIMLSLMNEMYVSA